MTSLPSFTFVIAKPSRGLFSFLGKKVEKLLFAILPYLVLLLVFLCSCLSVSFCLYLSYSLSLASSISSLFTLMLGVK